MLRHILLRLSQENGNPRKRITDIFCEDGGHENIKHENSGKPWQMQKGGGPERYKRKKH